MNDQAALTAWDKQFQNWVPDAQALMGQGKGKEAFAAYPWFTTEGEPFVPLAKPLAESRFGLVTTGGYSIDGEQEPMRPFPTFGDEVPQIRHIPTDVDRTKLVINHPGYDHKYAKEDINANLPFDRLGELVDEGVIGSLSRETIVLMGLQPNVRPLLEHTVPSIVEAFKADDVDAALLVPS